MKNGKILVGMSGGLDSAYAVNLLRREGCEVVGAALVFSDHTDIESVRRVAEELSVPLYEKDVKDLFREKVMGDFISCYQNGKTPNPCVVCNRYVKMRALYELSRSLGCDGFATGHYAKPVRLESGRFAIAMGKDKKKDQSYMLWGLSQEEIAAFVAPLCDLDKESIRQSAEAEGLSVARSKESQDICFIPDGDYVSFIRENAPNSRGFEEGNFVSVDGLLLGKHKGLCHYTVGQRKGLGIALGYPAFVTDMNPETCDITLASAEDSYKKEILVESLVFQGLEPVQSGEFDFLVKIRYAAPPVPCRVIIEGDLARVVFETPQRTPAPGQSAVFYQDDTIMLGGIIRRGIIHRGIIRRG
ncbi:MAG: tRNA 2-thiouridine(34) synthase MnmA [Clostridia bacterium]|nr:tRNA 2-thiouridine(34) synthase MnmA [Clostridia bacterium]